MIVKEKIASKVWLLSTVLILLINSVGCSSPPTAIPSEVPIVRISQALINEAVLDCEDKPLWGISFGLVRTNYVVGVNLEAAIILHNGKDTVRRVTLECKPTFVTNTEGETGFMYQKSPSLAHLWLKPEVDSIRLQPMETKVVKVSLMVPENISNLPDRWEIDLKADGTPIIPFTQVVSVKSVDIIDKKTGIVTPDTTAVFHLTHPLLEGVSSILSVVSTNRNTIPPTITDDGYPVYVDESPYVSSYDAEKGILTLDGLKSNAERTIAVTYEYQSDVTVAYDQRWLITMLR